MSWILFLAGILIIITVFLLVFSFDKQFSKKTRLIILSIGIVFLIMTLILIWKILSNPMMIL
ncbi:Protein of unknown function [Lactobacillus hominis]|uniref:ABC superfamily ATP binding cassette transporter, membrane protein n=1 Tax=Lactobacillus hominis DSM 23910 = CRBIP 24.179 TaxID=1423758 RepID=I7IVY3_9LACO|nr:Protein of unknown function [Lactobacillus hominis]KRM84613.1 hypothetical protein FC41_GL000592 [Lactobacillus hominis DSM 23910 = CRBIP 24.179]MCT3347905.1 hypothetical protein [Lactobacillus hominis]CCI82243.1 Protein of unknown function [Lactobacillus hominis DSM 23910 = CRBIP 24.179]